MRRAAFVHDGKLATYEVGKLLCSLSTAHVRAYDANIFEAFLVVVIRKEIERGEVVHGDVEEPLYLALVQIDGCHGVDACGLQKIGDELGGDGFARRRLAILARVAIVRDDGMDASGACALGGIGHDEKLHEGIVYRARNRLHEKDIFAAYRLHIPCIALAVGELLEPDISQLHIEICSDFTG